MGVLRRKERDKKSKTKRDKERDEEKDKERDKESRQRYKTKRETKRETEREAKREAKREVKREAKRERRRQMGSMPTRGKNRRTDERKKTSERHGLVSCGRGTHLAADDGALRRRLWEVRIHAPRRRPARRRRAAWGRRWRPAAGEVAVAAAAAVATAR